MYLAPATLDADLFDQLAGIIQVTTIAFLAGSLGGRLLGVGVRARGLPLLCGLTGLYAGTWLWNVGGWDGGPAIAGYGLLPALAGALAVAGFVRLVELAVAGPRW
jgi:hypothetical protein